MIADTKYAWPENMNKGDLCHGDNARNESHDAMCPAIKNGRLSIWLCCRCGRDMTVVSESSLFACTDSEERAHEGAHRLGQECVRMKYSREIELAIT